MAIASTEQIAGTGRSEGSLAARLSSLVQRVTASRGNVRDLVKAPTESSVLCLDLASTQPFLSVVRVEAATAKVKGAVPLLCPERPYAPAETEIPYTEGSPSPEHDHPLPDNDPRPVAPSPVESHPVESLPHDTSSPSGGAVFGITPEALRAALTGLPPWDEAIVVLPAGLHLSRNLSLPFSQSKTISRIVQVEIQDLLPFDCDPYHVTFRECGALPASSEHDVHVALYPKDALRKILALCRECGIDPARVLSVSSAAAGLVQILPHEARQSASFVISLSHDQVHVVFLLPGGDARADRMILRTTSSIPPRELIAFAEYCRMRYGLMPGQCFCSGATAAEADEIARVLNIPCQVVADTHGASEGGPRESDAKAHAALLIARGAALATREEHEQCLLADFRSGPFRYRPYREIVRAALVRSRPLLLTLALMLLVAPTVVYFVREYRRLALEQSTFNAVQALFPNETIPPGTEHAFLSGKIGQLRRVLDEYSSPDQVAPYTIIEELSRDIPRRDRVRVRNIKLRGNRLEVTVISGDPINRHKELDHILRNLNRNQRFANVRGRSTTESSAERGAIERVFEITLRD